MKGFMVVILMAVLNLGLAYAQDLEHHDEHGQMIEEPVDEALEKLGVCMVMGGEAAKEYFYTYEGKTYYFCCPSCSPS